MSKAIDPYRQNLEPSVAGELDLVDANHRATTARATQWTAVFTGVAALVAGFAVAIAFGSLQFAQKADARDQFFRELGIQPDLSAYLSTVDRIWAVENTGVGAAKIEYMIFANTRTGICFDSRTSGDHWAENQEIFLGELRRDLKERYSSYMKEKRLNNSDINIILDGGVFDLTEKIAPGKIRNLLKVNAQYKPDSFDISMRTQEAEGIDARLSRDFHSIVSDRTFQTCYCSTSGGFCNKSKNTFPFGSCRPHRAARFADQGRIAIDMRAAQSCDERSAEPKRLE